jgi:hypothetical protein
MAITISIPTAYYLTEKYLEQYSERVTLQWWHFTVPIALLVLILLTTVTSVVWRAARNNPVEALKYE